MTPLLQRTTICAVALGLCVTGCIPRMKAGRVVARKPAIELPSGPPRSSCEEAEWLELAPAVVQGRGSLSVGDTYGGVWTRTVTATRQGAAIFAFGTERALEARALADELGDNAAVDARIRQLRGSERWRGVAQTMVTSGFVIMFAGLATLIPALFIEDDTPTYDGVQLTVLYASLGAFTLGGILAPLGLLVQPSPKKRARYAVRTKLYTADDDLEALADGVSRHNARVRSECATDRPDGSLVSRDAPSRPEVAGSLPRIEVVNPFLDFTLFAPTLDAPATHRDERAGARLDR